MWMYFLPCFLVLCLKLRPWSEYLQSRYFSVVSEKTKVLFNFLFIMNVKAILYLNLRFTICCH